jgi:UDP-N-acetylmuramoyl-L-alanyl-D-glutamate--2,6-diaminopimelate ligase
MHMTLAHLVGDEAIVPAALQDARVVGLTSDSRRVKPGFVFAAFPGTKADGRSYIADAFAKGAIAAVAQSADVLHTEKMIAVTEPRKFYAQMAARFHGPQPETIAAVTGTNGKTSVSVFVRQIWAAMGFRAASLGTIGVVGPDGTIPLQHTTPDPMELHAIAAKLREEHVKHLVVEASSHGLSQFRLDGLKLAAGAFTNLTHDHLDYHATLEDYFTAKMRLFDELLPQGSAAVINADSPYALDVIQRATRRGLVVHTVGHNGRAIQIVDMRSDGLEQHLTLKTPSGLHAITLPLAGEFQVSNALVAAALVIATGGEEALAIRALQSLKGAAGRLDLVERLENGASVFVDYAHTPDALDNAISALRPFTKGKLVVVFGCGGDRDKAKRPVMGEIAGRLADKVIVTDDNPRTEKADVIRKEILAAAKGAVEIGDRAAAICAGVEMLGAGDILLVAGKGHESGQTVGTRTLPFSDHDAVRAAVRGVAYLG